MASATLDLPSSEFLLPADTFDLLRCPACGGELAVVGSEVHCAAAGCERVYPAVEGVPILVDEAHSVFSIEAFLARKATFFKPISPLREAISRLLPTLDLNVAAHRNFARLKRELKARQSKSRVLVIGGGILGYGMECLLDDPAIELIETAASLGPRTRIICDGHRLPLADESVDCVIAQAVLEHVLDPHQMVREIHRVLQPNGLVYADTPFIAQVHGREYDFTRFTPLGHRRLFRMFGELDSGISCGPATALAWTLRYFLLSFASGRKLRAALSGLSRLLFFWLKYADYLLANKPAALDAGMGNYFLGEKRNAPISDRDLLAQYRGGF
jgi:SAM-dependent methyltransferase